MTIAVARRVLLALVTLLLVDITPSLAGEAPFAVFEDWADPTIRFERWAIGRNDDALEVSREVQGRRLHMRFRRHGIRGGQDSGLVDVSNRMLANRASAITQWEVDFTVHGLTVIGCPTNLATTSVRAAALSLSKISDGSSGGAFGDATGDHYARVFVGREAGSTDPDDMLRVGFVFFRCNNVFCTDTSRVLFDPAIGAVRLGKRFTLRLILDAENSQFLAGVAGEPDVAFPYDPAL